MTIQQLAKVVRSKNAGPFEITLDVLFPNQAVFDHVRKSGILLRQTITRMYQLASPDDIIVLMFFEPALAWKCTFKRPWPQGSIGERDTFGAQLHAPLLSIVVDADQGAGAPPSPSSIDDKRFQMP